MIIFIKVFVNSEHWPVYDEAIIYSVHVLSEIVIMDQLVCPLIFSFKVWYFFYVIIRIKAFKKVLHLISHNYLQIENMEKHHIQYKHYKGM